MTGYCIFGLLLGIGSACLGAGREDMREQTVVQAEEVLVRPGADWLTEGRIPDGAGLVPVLALQTRLHVPGSKGEGCNWVLRVLINGEVLSENPSRPRLLNKPPAFEFAQGQYHFTWYNQSHTAWMTMFSDTYDIDPVGTGEDTWFLWDIGSYAAPGQRVDLRVQYAMPQLPSIIGQDSPLAVRDILLGLMEPEAVARLREAALGAGSGRRKVPVQVDADLAEAAGEPPYEIAWSGRPEWPKAQVTFEDLTGWKASAIGEGDVMVSATRAQRIWRRQTVRVTMGESKGIAVELAPPAPILLPDDFDAVNVWLYSNHAYGATGRPVCLTVTVIDSRGVTADLDCGELRGDYWELRQGLLRSGLTVLRPPVHFQGLTLGCARVNKPITMYLESLAFHKRERRPYEPLGRLRDPAFPTTEDNMLPPAPEGCVEEVMEAADGRGARFRSVAADGVVEYEVRAEGGGPGGISARLGDGPTFRPLAGAGLRIAGGTGGVSTAGPESRLLRAELTGGRLLQDWEWTTQGRSLRYSLEYQLRGRTLVVDVRAEPGEIEALELGRVEGLTDARGLEVPYLVVNGVPGPRIAMGGGAFTSVLLDWYHSNATRLDTHAARELPDEGGLRINGGAAYGRLTDGTRNGLRERILVTVSPRIEDTFPSIATPRSERIEQLAPCLFVMSSDFTPEYYHTLKRHGLNHVIAVHFAGIWWQRAGEGFAMRWRPRPDLTEAQVAAYREQVRGLGYLWGMLVNYDCFLPLNEYWDEGLVALAEDGRMREGWFGHYWTKPNAMAWLARMVGERIRQRYPTDCVYLDVHTNIGAEAIDFEAGVEGAGTARASILANAETIREVHRQQHALCSEGICRWMYAGLADMDYAQWVDVVKPDNKPLLPDFDLLRIHPRQIGTAMGFAPSCFFGEQGLAEFDRDPGRGTSHEPFYQWVAATLAHGHSAMIGYGYFPTLARTIHYYALLCGPQADYLPDTVADIAWYSEAHGRFLGTSEALRTGVRERGRLRITYRGGQVVFVNYSRQGPWEVTVGGRKFLLPPFGWAIEKPGEILAYSALVEGRRVDYVNCPEYIYLNSGEAAASEGGITVDGAVLINKGPNLTVIPCGDLGAWKHVPAMDNVFHDMVLAGPPENRGVRKLMVNARALLGREGRLIEERDGQGAVVSSRALQGDTVEIVPTSDVVDYLLR